MVFLVWNEQQKAKLIASPPCLFGDLFSRDFGVVRGARLLAKESDRALYVTLSYNLFWLHIEGSRVVAINCLDEVESELLFFLHYYDFPADLIRKAHCCFAPGSTVPLAFQNYKGNKLAPPKATVIPSNGANERRIYTLRQSPPLRAAFLQLEIGRDECILSTRVLIGDEANARRIESLKIGGDAD
jgi:hypothetical protein